MEDRRMSVTHRLQIICKAQLIYACREQNTIPQSFFPQTLIISISMEAMVWCGNWFHWLKIMFVHHLHNHIRGGKLSLTLRVVHKFSQILRLSSPISPRVMTFLSQFLWPTWNRKKLHPRKLWRLHSSPELENSRNNHSVLFKFKTVTLR